MRQTRQSIAQHNASTMHARASHNALQTPIQIYTPVPPNLPLNVNIHAAPGLQHALRLSQAFQIKSSYQQRQNSSCAPALNFMNGSQSLSSPHLPSIQARPSTKVDSFPVEMSSIPTGQMPSLEHNRKSNTDVKVKPHQNPNQALSQQGERIDVNNTKPPQMPSLEYNRESNNDVKVNTIQNPNQAPRSTETIRSSEVEAALRSKPQRGRKRENLNGLERLALTRTRNREHAKHTRCEGISLFTSLFSSFKFSNFFL